MPGSWNHGAARRGAGGDGGRRSLGRPAGLPGRTIGRRDFCYAASDRTETTRSVAASCDVVLLLGTEDDADTRYLTGLARSCHAKAHAIADVSEIAAAWLAGTSAIGLAETTSAGPGLAGGNLGDRPGRDD